MQSKYVTDYVIEHLWKRDETTLPRWIQRVISAVHSAIRGGMIFGEYLVRHGSKLLIPFEHVHTYMCIYYTKRYTHYYGVHSILLFNK